MADNIKDLLDNKRMLNNELQKHIQTIRGTIGRLKHIEDQARAERQKAEHILEQMVSEQDRCPGRLNT